jgi:hypothetical protein
MSNILVSAAKCLSLLLPVKHSSLLVSQLTIEPDTQNYILTLYSWEGSTTLFLILLQHFLFTYL